MPVFSSAVFNSAVYFTDSGVAVKTGTGGIDPARRKTIHKPTGLVDRPRKDARKSVAERVEEAREIHAEAKREAQREFIDEVEIPGLLPAISGMSIAQIDEEIGIRLREQLQRKQQAEQDEEFLILMAFLL